MKLWRKLKNSILVLGLILGAQPALGSNICQVYLMGALSGDLNQVSETGQSVLKKVIGRIDINQSTSRQFRAKFIPELPSELFEQSHPGKIFEKEIMALQRYNLIEVNANVENVTLPVSALENIVSGHKNSGQHFKRVSEKQLITEYASHLIYNYNDGKDPYAFSPRFVSDLDKPSVQTAVNDLEGPGPVLEIKFVSLNDAKVNSQGMVKIQLTPSMADRLKTLHMKGGDILDTLESIERELAQWYPSFNDPDLLSPGFKILGRLLDRDPSLLTPKFVAYHNDHQYASGVGAASMFLTVSKDVEMYNWDHKLKSDRLKQYDMEDTIFSLDDDLVFLKLTNGNAKLDEGGSAHYDLVRRNIRSHSLAVSAVSGDKYIVGRHIQNSIHSKSIDTELIDNGVMAWLLNGTANLHYPLKGTDLLTRGKIELAYPFTSKSGANFLLRLSYIENNRNSGERQASLKSISIEDEFGEKIDVDGKFGSAIRLAQGFEDDAIIGLNVEGQVIPFRVRIKQREHEEYKDFFQAFYKNKTSPFGKSRTLRQLGEINEKGSVNRARRRFRRQNGISFFKNRTGKLILNTLLLIGGLHVYDNYSTLFGEESANDHGLVTRASQVSPASPTIRIKGLRDRERGAVDVIAQDDGKGAFEFQFDPPGKLIANKDGIIELTNNQGREVQFKIIETKKDEKEKNGKKGGAIVDDPKGAKE